MVLCVVRLVVLCLYKKDECSNLKCISMIKIMQRATSQGARLCEDDHGVADQDDGAALVVDVAIAVSPSQFHLANCQTATYSATPVPTKASWRLPLSTPSGSSYSSFK